MKKIVLIVAGGNGERMSSEIPKQFLLLNKTPILMHTIKAFSKFNEIVLVLPKKHFNYWKTLCEINGFKQKLTLVEGGGSRFNSVKNGLKKIPENSIVLIHDGVRPIVSKHLINSLITVVKKGIGSVPVIPMESSIRKTTKKDSKHVNRKNLCIVQTPQCFLGKDIKDAYQQNFCDSFTDDASVFENNGGSVKVVDGDKKNIKITTKEDLKIAKLFMQ